MSDRAAAAWLAVPLLAAVLLAATYLAKPVFRFLTDEDSVIEWGQVLALVAVFVGSASVALVAYRRRAYGLTMLFGTTAVAAFVVAGEEISWGQRLLGIVTPAALEVINKQGEPNVHNIRLVQTALWVAELLVSVYALAVPLLVAGGWVVLPGRFSYSLVPPLFLATWFALPLGYRLARLTVVPQARFAFERMGELTELVLYGGAAVFVWFVLLRLRREPHPDRSPRSSTGEPNR